MSFEKGETVTLDDTHSEYDGETGEIVQVVTTMFGDEKYTVEFDDGREAGLAEDALTRVDDATDTDHDD